MDLSEIPSFPSSLKWGVGQALLSPGIFWKYLSAALLFFGRENALEQRGVNHCIIEIDQSIFPGRPFMPCTSVPVY